MSIRYLHDSLSYPLNPSQTCSDKVCKYGIAVVASPIIIALGIASLPLIGIAYGIDGCYNLIHDKYTKGKHEKRMKQDWRYRVTHLAPRINTLKLWQEKILDCNQFERAILQIAEANDIPYELWKDLSEHDEFFKEQIQKYGTDEYKKEECVKYAIDHFIGRLSLMWRDTHTDEQLKAHIDRLLSVII